MTQDAVIALSFFFGVSTFLCCLSCLCSSERSPSRDARRRARSLARRVNLDYSQVFGNHITYNPMNEVQTIYRKPALITSESQRSPKDIEQRVTWDPRVEAHETDKIHYYEKKKRKKVSRRSKEPSFPVSYVFRSSSINNNLREPLLDGTDDTDESYDTTDIGIVVEPGHGIN